MSINFYILVAYNIKIIIFKVLLVHLISHFDIVKDE